jgi:hypothetical protein
MKENGSQNETLERELNENILFNHATLDTTFIELTLNSTEFYKNGGSIFYCDIVQAKDNGLPYLILTDVIQLSGKKLDKEPFSVRFELIKQILGDTELYNTTSQTKLGVASQNGILASSINNEYRLRFPLLFENNDILFVYNTIIPNFYGYANGVRFTINELTCVTKSLDGNNVEKDCIIRKTRFPEIYELYNMDGITPILPNNILYIPSMEVANKISEKMSKTNSTKISIIFNTRRNKWQPKIV